MQKVFLISFLILALFIAKGQNSNIRFSDLGLNLEKWTTNEGLPQNSVNDIIQTTDGYLWLATYGGVAKFDGLKFEKLSEPELADQRVIFLFEDSRNDVWIGTEDNGVFRYNKDSLTHFGPEQDWGLVGVHKVFENDADELVVAVYYKGLYILKNGRFQKIQHPTLEQNTVQHVYEHEDGYFLLSTDNGVIKYSSNKIQLLETNGLEETNSGSKSFSLRYIFKDFDNKYRLGTSGYVYKWDEDHPNIKLDNEYGTERSYPVHFKSKDKSHWLGTPNDGIFRKVGTETMQPLFQKELSKSGIISIFQDREGNIWIGTTGSGLAKISKTSFSSIGLESGLSQDVMLGVYEDENQLLWLGTHAKGFNILKDKKVIKQFLPERGVWAIQGNGQGIVWVGLYGSEGLVEYSYKNNEIEERFITEFYDQAVLVLHFDTLAKRLWVGSEKGLHYLENGKSKYVDLSEFTEDLRPRAITTSPEGVIWMGTRGHGLFKVDGDKIQQFRMKEGLAHDNIRSLYYDTDNSLWIGTYGGGLTLLKENKFHIVNESDGLFNNVISSIVEDENSNLWMSCNEGIFTLSKTQVLEFIEGKIGAVTCQSYTTSNGMGSSETNGGFQPASARLASGELIFPTMKGVAVVDPNELKINDNQEDIIFEKVIADNLEISFKSGKYEIPPGTKNLEIYYTLPNFTNPELLQFQVKLKGYQEEFSNVGNRRVAYFSALNPKIYTFQAKAVGSNGVWNEIPAEVVIEVIPFFYETTWFKWLTIGFVLLLIIAVFAVRNRQAKSREKLLKQEVLERTKDLQKEKELTEEALTKVEKQTLELEKMGKAKSNFFASVSHELKTPLTLIKGPVEALLQNNSNQFEKSVKQDLELIQNQSTQLSHLITQLLDIARSEDGKWATEREVFDFRKKVELLLKDYAQGFAQKEIELQFESNEAACLIETDADIVYKIVSNLLSNALKFTPQSGSVQVKLLNKDGSVYLEVVDSGQGINDEDLPFVFERFFKSSNNLQSNSGGSGIGLALVKQFVEILEGTIKVENTEKAGAKFILELPIGNVADGVSSFESELSSNLESLPKAKSIDKTTEADREDVPLILIVDDNEGIRQFVMRNLEQDFKVIEARDGVEGYEMAKIHQPDLIVSDIMMPRKDGLEMLSDIRQDTETNFIALLLLSAKGSEETRAKGWEYGADGYMAKPFNGHELKARVQAILLNRRKLREKLLLERKQESKNRTQETDSFKIQFDELIQKEIPNPEFSFKEHIAEFNMSLSTFTRAVKDKFDTTPQIYLREKRLLLAKELLENSDETVSEIAYASGFNSVSYFSRIYKKYFGETPSKR
jgi:signal transduction histidine kinase/ligand-binding sensor domain-containing protein/DNA-binding response OmpR family regulator